MELSLRKARKLEAKILEHVNSMQTNSSVKVRVMAESAERDQAIFQGRMKFLMDFEAQKKLLVARFHIRQLIAEANHNVGINALINRRDTCQALLGKSNGGLEPLNVAELNDLVASKAARLESTTMQYDSAVTLNVTVATKEDVESFRKEDSFLRKEIEKIEDELSQKNMGAKIKLNDDIVASLQAAELI